MSPPFAVISLILYYSCVVGPVASGFDLQGGISPDPQSFLQKYAMIKLYESCFGAEHMHNVSTT